MDDAARDRTLERLAASRAEIRRLLDPPPRVTSDTAPHAASESSQFPRSRTMRMLMSVRGASTVAAVAGGLLISRPALAFRVLRMVPTGAVARMLLVKAVSALRAKDR